MIQSKCCFATAVLQTEGLPMLSKEVASDIELHSVVVRNHAQAYHLVNKVYHHQAVVSPAAVAPCCELINGLLMMQRPVPEQRGCAAAE
jgi:hypothetical protein